MRLPKTLYLLVNEEHSAVKVGISIDPHNRGAALAVRIDFARSLEVGFDHGSARDVERLVHFWFRDRRAIMPPGDGCTEWLQIEAMPDVVEFLKIERKRLGVTYVRPVRLEPAVSARSPKPAQVSFEERWDKAAQHNVKVLDWVRSTLHDLYAADIVIGILPPTIRYGILGGRASLSARAELRIGIQLFDGCQ